MVLIGYLVAHGLLMLVRIPREGQLEGALAGEIPDVHWPDEYLEDDLAHRWKDLWDCHRAQCYRKG